MAIDGAQVALANFYSSDAFVFCQWMSTIYLRLKPLGSGSILLSLSADPIIVNSQL